MKTLQYSLSEETLEQYLLILNLDKTDADLSFLRTLIRTHLHTIPYENFSKFLYVQTIHDRGHYIPGTKEFLDHFQSSGWGGTCYPLNIHFSKLLRSLGYTCTLVRVKAGHVAIIVEFDQVHYYVDVGYGSPLFQPIKLPQEGTIKLKKLGEEIYIRRLEERIYEIDRHADGNSFVKKEIEWRPQQEDDFLPDIRKSSQDTEDNIVMRRLSATIFKPRYCYYLNNEMITRKNEYTKEVSKFNDRYKWAATVKELFGTDETIALDAVTFLEKRGIQLFS